MPGFHFCGRSICCKCHQLQLCWNWNASHHVFWLCENKQKPTRNHVQDFGSLWKTLPSLLRLFNWNSPGMKMPFQNGHSKLIPLSSAIRKRQRTSFWERSGLNHGWVFCISVFPLVFQCFTFSFHPLPGNYFKTQPHGNTHMHMCMHAHTHACTNTCMRATPGLKTKVVSCWHTSFFLRHFPPEILMHFKVNKSS